MLVFIYLFDNIAIFLIIKLYYLVKFIYNYTKEKSIYLTVMIMRNIFKFIFSIALLLSLIPKGLPSVSAEPLFAGGDGTQLNPFLIENATQLDHVRHDLDAHYALVSDIDLSSLLGDFDSLDATYNNGSGWIPIGSNEDPFTGTLDGRGFHIHGLSIKQVNNIDGVFIGLFGVLDNALIYNFDLSGQIYLEEGNFTGVGLLSGSAMSSHITGLNVTGSVYVLNTNGAFYVAGLVAESSHNVIEHILVDVPVFNGSSFGAGGIVAFSTHDLIENVENSNSVTAARSYNTGGIVGYATDSTLVNVRNHGNIRGLDYVGGIVGRAERINIVGALNTGTITTSFSYAGGIIGILYNSSFGAVYKNTELELLINQGDVVSENVDNSLNELGGIIGFFWINVDEDDYLPMKHLYDFKTTLPLIHRMLGTVMGVFDQNVQIIIDGNYSHGSVNPINLFEVRIEAQFLGDFIEPDDFETLVSTFNSLEYDFDAIVSNNLLNFKFSQAVFFTQGSVNGPMSDDLVVFNTKNTRLLPTSSRSVPSIEVFSTLVSWEIDTLTGWKTLRDNSGTFYAPLQSIDYEENKVFIRLFAILNSSEEELPDTSDSMSWSWLILLLGLASLVYPKKES
jgi:hypothetical protein